MEFILVICTSGWILCGQLIETRYPSEQSCYRALSELYRRQPASEFKYVLCKPAAGKSSDRSQSGGG